MRSLGRRLRRRPRTQRTAASNRHGSRYAGFPAATIVGTYSASACNATARAYLRDARLFVAHSGAQAAYSADNYYLELVQDFADFQAHSCNPATLGRALETGMTRRQRAALVAGLPATMAQTVRESLDGRS